LSFGRPFAAPIRPVAHSPTVNRQTAESGAAPVFHGVSFNPADKSVRVFSHSDLEQELRDAAVFSWIDIQAEDISALNEVLRIRGIDLALVSHFDAPEVLPRIVERPDCLAFYLYEIDEPERHLDTSGEVQEIGFLRMILVLGADFVLTYHRRPLDAVDYVKDTCADSFRLAGRTPAFVAFLFLQRGLYDFAHLNLANDNYLDVLETKLLRGEPIAGEISVTGRNILTLKKLAASLQIVLTLLATKQSPFISDAARTTFNEMLHNAIALRDAIDSSRDMLDGVLAGIQAEAAKRTSEIVRLLTIVSAILLPLTVVTGIYGMNFEHMPELRARYGYFVVLGLMAVVVIGLLLAFRRLGWIGGRPRAR